MDLNFRAAAQGDTGVIQQVLENDISSREALRSLVDSDGLNILDVAASHGQYNTTKYLLDKVYDVQKDAEIVQESHDQAYVNGNYHVVELIVDQGGRIFFLNSEVTSEDSDDEVRAESYFRLGNKRLELEAYETALRCFEKAFLLDSKYRWIALRKIGHCNFNLQRFKESAEAYGGALNGFPSNYDDAQFMGMYGLSLNRAKQWDEAVPILERAISLQRGGDLEKLATVLDALGDAYYGMERDDEALNAYRESLSIDPDCASSLVGIGLIASYNKDKKTALDVLLKLQSLGSNGFHEVYSCMKKHFDMSEM